MANEVIDRTAAEQDGRGTVSFSIRLTEKQRDLLARAAEARGWTITNLLKNAALEKAAHIVNTGAPNQVDFHGIADKVAEQVFGARDARVLDHVTKRPTRADVFEKFEDVPDLKNYVYPVEVSPWPMSSNFLTQLRQAARYGGMEFLNLVIDASTTLAARDEHLPAPIDPNDI
jgi:hypothetical protein